jgi:hypothetical protein
VVISWGIEMNKKIFGLGEYVETVYNRYGYDTEGYDMWGYDTEGYDRKGSNRFGYDREGFNWKELKTNNIDYKSKK